MTIQVLRGLISASVTSLRGRITAWAQEGIDGSISSKGSAWVGTGGNIASFVSLSAGGPASQQVADLWVAVGGQLSGNLSATGDLSVHAVGDISGNTAAQGKAVVSSWGSILGAIFSGEFASIEAGQSITGAIHAPNGAQFAENVDFSGENPAQFEAPEWAIPRMSFVLSDDEDVVSPFFSDPPPQTPQPVIVPYVLIDADHIVLLLNRGARQQPLFRRDANQDWKELAYRIVHGAGMIPEANPALFELHPIAHAHQINEFFARIEARRAAQNRALLEAIEAARRQAEQEILAAQELERRTRAEQEAVQQLIRDMRRLQPGMVLRPDGSVTIIARDRSPAVQDLIQRQGGLEQNGLYVFPDQTITRRGADLLRPTRTEIADAAQQRYLEIVQEEQDPVEGALDRLQVALDVASLIPILEYPASLLNAGVSGSRGDPLGMGLNLLAMVPFVGDGATFATISRRGLRAVRSANLEVRTATHIASSLEILRDANRISHAVEESRLIVAASIRSGHTTREQAIELLVQSNRATREQATALVREAEEYAANAAGETLERFRQAERYFTANTTNQLRNTPGTVIGDGNLLPVNGNWLIDGAFGGVPPAVAQRLSGRRFDTFDAFREQFWKEVADIPDLARQFDFDPQNIFRMRNGSEPEAARSLWHLDNRSFVLHHIDPIERGGGVYCLASVGIGRCLRLG